MEDLIVKIYTFKHIVTNARAHFQYNFSSVLTFAGEDQYFFHALYPISNAISSHFQ